LGAEACYSAEVAELDFSKEAHLKLRKWVKAREKRLRECAGLDLATICLVEGRLALKKRNPVCERAAEELCTRFVKDGNDWQAVEVFAAARSVLKRLCRRKSFYRSFEERIRKVIIGGLVKSRTCTNNCRLPRGPEEKKMGPVWSTSFAVLAICELYRR
jgi:hypothetical protein